MNEALRKSILRKIAGLLRLGDRARNSSEGEALNAMRKAEELMRAYNLTFADVRSESGEDDAAPGGWKYERVVAGDWVGAVPAWIRIVGSCCGRLAGTAFLWGRRKKRGVDKACFVFAGDQGDIAIAALLFEYLRYFADKGAAAAVERVTEKQNDRLRSYCPWCGGRGCLSCLGQTQEELRARYRADVKQASAHVIKASYCDGFAVAVEDRTHSILFARRSTAPGESASDSALCLAIHGAKEKWLERAMAKHEGEMRIAPPPARRRKCCADAFEVGLRDGERVDMATERRMAL